MMCRASILLFASVVLLACNRPEEDTVIEEIMSERRLSFEKERVILVEYFVVNNPPYDSALLRAVIDKHMAASLAKLPYKNYYLSKYFYQATEVIHKDFKPYFDPDCITNCGDGVHMWDAGYNYRLGSVRVKKNACQLTIHYAFYHSGWFWQDVEMEKFYSRKILDEAACIKMNGPGFLRGIKRNEPSALPDSERARSL